MAPLSRIDSWTVDHAAAAVVGPDGVVETRGDEERVFALASVSKLLVAYSILIAAESGEIDLADPAGPPDSTVRHLLAHASGLPFEGTVPVSRPGARRIYSNAGFDLVAEVLAQRTGAPFARWLGQAVLEPLVLTETVLAGRPSSGVNGSLRDLGRFAGELLAPTLVSEATLAAATSVVFPGLAGVLPGFGPFDPLDWGLGFELKDGKESHWTGRGNSPATFGHFGGSGTFLWVDPIARLALVCLTDRTFGPWAGTAWPELSDAVLGARGPT